MQTKNSNLKRLKADFLLLAFSCFFFSSCGYQWQTPYPSESIQSIAVDFIQEDDDGALTCEIVKELTKSGLFVVNQGKADLRLEVKIEKGSSETIGYRYAKEKISGEVSKNLVSSEGRRGLAIQAQFLRGEEVVFGPYEITGDADYDYLVGDSFQDLTFLDRQGTRVNVLPFSLGQLEPKEAAFDAARVPLYSQIAKKIVDALCQDW